MPAADLHIHDNQVARTAKIDDISVRNDILFTNDKGEDKRQVQKRSEKALQKLVPALQRVLLPTETVLYLAQARSPLTAMEQLTAAWWTGLLAASVIVITNKRILFFPVKRDGSWKESVRALHWGDLEEVKPKGLLVRNVTFKSRNGTKLTYTNFRRADAKKITAIATALLPAASGESTSTHDWVQLCPDCRNILTPGQYLCSSCGLTFKNEKSMVTRSILLPGGGYFYTGHPLVALLPAVVEGLLVLEILVLLFSGLASPKAIPNIFSSLLLLGLFWALETAVTILHCRRYVREYIPEKRDLARSRQERFTAKIGG
jgi:Bacterial PH domain